MKPADHDPHRPIRRGPITSRFNGRGARPWLPRMGCEPGWVSLAGHPPPRRPCRRCAVQVSAVGGGKVPLFWEEGPPGTEERCARCLRSYGERSEASAGG